MQRASFVFLVLVISACSSSTTRADPPVSGGTQRAPALAANRAEAIFAGGCFWCMEAPFESIDGVESVTSGYTGGRVQSPSYRAVSAGGTGHTEAIRIVFDPSRVTYAQLLEVFWHNIDPTQRDGQFCDRGTQYRTGIFFVDGQQQSLAEASQARAAATLRRAVVTEITAASTFWVAESYHQNYYRTHPTEYQRYRTGCGRDRRLEQLWGSAAAH